MTNQKNYPLEQWHKELILKQFSLCYGLKQLVQDGNKDALMALSQRTCFRLDFIKQNIEAIKQI